MGRQRGFGRTMGQDQAGHAPLNPPDAPRISAEDVHATAKLAGVEVRRGDNYGSDGDDMIFVASTRGMWWTRRPGGEWLTAYRTNYLTRELLLGMAMEGED